MKPRIRFLNFVHRPLYFHPEQWCITEKWASFFWRPDSREGKLLMHKDKIWGWKEHSQMMEIYLGKVVLLDYKFKRLEFVLFEKNLVCMRFSKRINHPPMPGFDWDDTIPDLPC